MEALNDMTEGAPDGVFSNVFCRVLFAQQAAIDTLASRLIQVLNAIFGGERFSKSADGLSIIDNGADKTGFKLGADGRLIASNVEISGIISANGGSFKDVEIQDVTITGDSLFQGNIDSGPLVLSNNSPISNTYNYQVGTSAAVIYNEAKNAIGFAGVSGASYSYSVTGTYGNKTIIRIRFTSTLGAVSYSTTVYYQDGTSEIAAETAGFAAHGLQYALSFQYTSGGKTFKLIEIPTQQQTIGSGIVYSDKGTLKIS
jgi:hypothetical protein